jgi:hypothetical protein
MSSTILLPPAHSFVLGLTVMSIIFAAPSMPRLAQFLEAPQQKRCSHQRTFGLLFCFFRFEPNSFRLSGAGWGSLVPQVIQNVCLLLQYLLQNQAKNVPVWYQKTQERICAGEFRWDSPETGLPPHPAAVVWPYFILNRGPNNKRIDLCFFSLSRFFINVPWIWTKWNRCKTRNIQLGISDQKNSPSVTHAFFFH